MDVAVRAPVRPIVRRTRDGDPRSGPTGADVDPIRPASTLAFDGYSVLECDPAGQIVEPRHGLYDMDCRILSRHRILLDGKAPRSVGGCVAVADRWSGTLVVDRNGGTADGPRLPQDAWAIRTDRRVGCGMIETIRVTNHSMLADSARLTIELDADFVDMLALAGAVPEQRIETTWDPDGRQLTFEATASWEGRKDVRAVAIRTSQPPAEVTAGGSEKTARSVVFDLELGPGEHSEIELVYRSLVDGRWRDPSQATERVERREAWRRTRT